MENGDRKRYLNCIKCNIDLTKDMEHCDDCDVCVYGYDHHCVFFSKCIGGGNIYCFGGSIGMLICNFVIVFIFLILDQKDHPHKIKFGGYKRVPKKEEVLSTSPIVEIDQVAQPTLNLSDNIHVYEASSTEPDVNIIDNSTSILI